MVERLTSAAQGLFPLVVALALRQAARDAGNQGQRGQGVQVRPLLPAIGRKDRSSGPTESPGALESHDRLDGIWLGSLVPSAPSIEPSRSRPDAVPPGRNTGGRAKATRRGRR